MTSMLTELRWLARAEWRWLLYPLVPGLAIVALVVVCAVADYQAPLPQELPVGAGWDHSDGCGAECGCHARGCTMPCVPGGSGCCPDATPQGCPPPPTEAAQ